MLMESLDREIKEEENVIEKLTLANEISDDVVDEISEEDVVEENSDDVAVDENSEDWEYFGDLAGTYNQQRVQEDITGAASNSTLHTKYFTFDILFTH